MTRRMKTPGERVAEQLIPLPKSEIPEHEPPREVSADDTPLPIEPSAFGALIESVVTIDVASTFEVLTMGLQEELTEFANVLGALGRADHYYIEAVKLARAAKLEEQRVDRDMSEELEVIRTAARDELETEKAAGKRSKAPTIQDVDDRMMSNWPTRMHELRRRSEEHHAARAIAEGLETAWRSRAASLRSIMDRYAPTRLT